MEHKHEVIRLPSLAWSPVRGSVWLGLESDIGKGTRVVAWKITVGPSFTTPFRFALRGAFSTFGISLFECYLWPAIVCRVRRDLAVVAPEWSFWWSGTGHRLAFAPSAFALLLPIVLRTFTFALGRCMNTVVFVLFLFTTVRLNMTLLAAIMAYGMSYLYAH